MNVSFYTEQKNDSSLYIGWYEGLVDCGVKNIVPIEKSYEILKILDFIPDLQILENPSDYELDLLQEKKAKHTVCITEDYKEYYKNYSFVNLWVEPCFYDKKTEKLFKDNGLPFHYCPLASQESLISFHTELNRIYDVSSDYPLEISNLKTIEVTSDYISSEIVYGNSKVNLNKQTPRKDCVYLNQKSFDIPMSGNFQLSTIPEIVDIFEGKVGYCSEDEIVDKILYYVNNEEERTRMAIKSYEVCIAKHTYTYRMRDLLKKLNLL